MTGALTLRVITPDQVLLDTQVNSVKVPASDGLMGILPMHAHMVTVLDAGLLTYETGGKEQVLFVSGGFAEVRENTVRVVSEAGERPDGIDEERAAAAEARARVLLDEGRGPSKVQIDLLRAEFALRRARFRLRAKRYPRSS